MSILSWVVLGLVAGALAKLIYPGNQGGGIFATIGLGILGALAGGFVGQLLGIGAAAAGGFSLASLVTAILGAMLLIFLWGLATSQR
ncbi:GlsB/YeaQ/YmgE family stress response membrane protein [Oscillatoriales cyanobacterium LEGE 11467]|uniref:GlsB/YeaQ/YmgE family stress response membrane protein n=1 Tax=Zarconia navalis LEGE 11467 TaxID=1828826 RepID=A0A928Z8W0_9CYAN|nr:GlsB/YeaQ/YmgE family stress response membrane protein [Zarconia navalis]MBE9041950.1 GlsB/YeaQ/YmgE family stress response membrane protein [Zarconia navalis LEGE 11467]